MIGKDGGRKVFFMLGYLTCALVIVICLVYGSTIMLGYKIMKLGAHPEMLWEYIRDSKDSDITMAAMKEFVQQRNGSRELLRIVIGESIKYDRVLASTLRDYSLKPVNIEVLPPVLIPGPHIVHDPYCEFWYDARIVKGWNLMGRASKINSEQIIIKLIEYILYRKFELPEYPGLCFTILPLEFALRSYMVELVRASEKALQSGQRTNPSESQSAGRPGARFVCIVTLGDLYQFRTK